MLDLAISRELAYLVISIALTDLDGIGEPFSVAQP